MKRLIGAAITLGFCFIVPATAFANVGGGMTLDIAFAGSCDQHGYLEVENTSAKFVVYERRHHWSAARSIHRKVGSTPIADPGDRLVLRLFASDHATVLFESDAFAHSGTAAAYFSSFRASLDCSTRPYRALLSDTAIADPRPAAGLSAIGWLAVALAIAFGSGRLRRRALDAR